MKKIIEHEGVKYEVVKVIIEGRKSEEQIFFEKWSDEAFCKKAVSQNGDSLQYVKEKKTLIKIARIKWI